MSSELLPESNYVIVKSAGDLWKALHEGKTPRITMSAITLDGRTGINIPQHKYPKPSDQRKWDALERALALCDAEGGDRAEAMRKLIARKALAQGVDRREIINMPLDEFVGMQRIDVDLGVQRTCERCGGPWEDSDIKPQAALCSGCNRTPLGDLDVMIRTPACTPPEHIERHITQWPQVRHFLRQRFGDHHNELELWERCIDWLQAEGRLHPNGYLPLELDYLCWLLRNGFPPHGDAAHADKLQRLRSAQCKLEHWLESNTSADFATLVEDFLGLSSHYQGLFPKPAMYHWRMFQRLGKCKRNQAEPHAQELLSWIKAEMHLR